jgi:hypothetical protein
MTMKSCPFLGLEYDPTTYNAYASDGNSCHKIGSPKPVNLQYQEQVCLSKNYLTCPIYLEKQPQLSYSNIYSDRPVRSGKTIRFLLAAICLISVLLILAFSPVSDTIAALFSHPNDPTLQVPYTKTATALQKAVDPTQVATLPKLNFPLILRQPTLTPTITHTPSPTETATPEPTSTARVNIRPTQVRQQFLPTQKPVKPTNTSVPQPTPPPYRPTVAP